MKRVIYFLGIVSANLMLFGSLFKAMHWPGASILLALGILIFCFAFLPLSLRSNYIDQTVKNNKWLYIVTYFVFAICLVGALFKIMHWPGAGILLVIGVPLPFVLFLPVYLYHTRKPKSQTLMNNLGVMFGLTFLAVFSVMLALNVNSRVIEGFALNAFNNENLLRFYRSVEINNSQDEIVTQKAEAICQYIEAIKGEIVQSTVSNNVDNMDDLNPLTMSNKSKEALSFLYELDMNGKTRAEVLWGMLDEYAELISSSEKASNELKTLTKNLLSTKNDFTSSKESHYYNWFDREFPSNQLALVMNVLTRIQSDLKFLETEFICSENFNK